MRITYSESKDNSGRPGKGLIISLGLRAKARPNIYKKSKYAIVKICKQDLSKTIRNSVTLLYKSRERRRHKNETTDNHFNSAKQLAKFMMRSDVLNSHTYPIRTKMTSMKQIPTSHIFL